jgi:DNA-binding NarL/FixJ family response regulator
MQLTGTEHKIGADLICTLATLDSVMKILIVDDHALFREGLCYVINGLDEHVTILEASDFDQAMQHVAANADLDLVLLDLFIPGKDGFAALDTLAKKYPALTVVIISASRQQSDIQRALGSGAMGYIPKDTTSKVLLNALRLVFSGGIYVPSEMARLNATAKITSTSQQTILTPRQTEVLALIAKGLSNKEIASTIHVTEATVKMHVTSILKSLDVGNRTQAAMAAEKLGLGVANNSRQ